HPLDHPGRRQPRLRHRPAPRVPVPVLGQVGPPAGLARQGLEHDGHTELVATAGRRVRAVRRPGPCLPLPRETRPWCVAPAGEADVGTARAVTAAALTARTAKSGLRRRGLRTERFIGLVSLSSSAETSTGVSTGVSTTASTGASTGARTARR